MISKKYPTPVKHPRSQKNPHLTNIRDLKKKNTPHLTNIRDLKKKKYPTPNKHPRSQKKKKKKNTPHLTNIRNLNLFSREKFTRKNGKKTRESFVKRLVHLSKGWSICQKVRFISQKVCQKHPFLYYSRMDFYTGDFPSFPCSPW